MFRDGFYSAGESLEALEFSSNLRDEKTAANLTPNSARASAANSGFNLARKTETNLTRANLTEQNARVNLGSNLRASQTATSKTLGSRQNAASQICAESKRAQTSVNLTASEVNLSGFSSGKFNESELDGLQNSNLTQIKTVDIHSHLLSADVKFDRFYDKLALAFSLRNST